MSDLPKTFDPAEIEARWYAHWEGQGRFRPERPEAEPFTIVIPPPNVTGSLHIGHALDLTLQDILVRHARLKGRDALWVVGTDHAGIATQMVVERNLASQGIKRTDMPRDAFIEHVWEWKAQSGGAITRQLRRLGASCDWSREQFTMDPHFSAAVTKTFVDLYNEGLIYRDKRLVNWDPHFRTAISDLEVETREVAGKFWHFSYPLADGTGAISVATTRPETMLADMAVAVHPEDARYAALVGKQVRLPITGRLVPIVADTHADPELGSGAVKITPGHDFNDFEVGIRMGLRAGAMLNMLDGDARILQTADSLIPEALLGLDRFEARKRVVEMLEADGALERVEDRVIATPFGDRSGVVIEPWLTDQWYVDAAKLAGPAIDAVRNGDIRVVPETWKKTWYNWLENIQPWCVSRQLWWGHRIPAWYGPELRDGNYHFQVETPGKGGIADKTKISLGKIFVAEGEAEALQQARAYYGDVYAIEFGERGGLKHTDAMAGGYQTVILGRDEDVLDTWFSSALWPFATLGWPEQRTDPNTVRPELVEGPSFLAGATEKDGASTTPDQVRGRTESGTGSLLSRHYPNDVLISGFDILFFWDARMAMQGIHLLGKAPWKTLYLHGLVRAPDGQKMSKSKGNTVDPIGLIDRYGADALRFFMAAMESQGRDIKIDEKRIEGYRNFATKLWNAARFCQSNGISASQTLLAPEVELPVNRWIIAETIETVQKLDLALADLRFDEAANTIYQFVWSRFCDWYLELIKPVLSKVEEAERIDPPRNGEGDHAKHGGGAPQASETRAVAGWVLDQILVMLHPFMPFITEELWHALAGPAHPRPYDLILARWPEADARSLDVDARVEIDWLIRLVGEIRTARTELNVPPSARLPMRVADASQATIERLARHDAALARLARVDRAGAGQGAALQLVVDEATYALALGDVVDVAAERARLAKSIETAAKERDGLAARLANPAFVERARPEAVDKTRADHADKSAEAERLTAALARLG